MNRCPKCGGHAYVISTTCGKPSVKMECDACKILWYTPSKICPACRKPNGFATPGMCSECYGERLDKKERGL